MFSCSFDPIIFTHSWNWSSILKTTSFGHSLYFLD